MIRFQITGQTEISKALQGLASAVQKKVAMEAMEEAVQPVVVVARLLAPVGETGRLRDSIGFAVRQYRRGQVTYGVIGARRGFGVTSADGSRTDPANYAHLVEYGHAVAGDAVAYVDPHPFLRPAWEATKARVLVILGQAIGSGIEHEAAMRAEARTASRARREHARAVALGAPA